MDEPWNRYPPRARCWCGDPYVQHDWPGDRCSRRGCPCVRFRARPEVASHD